MQGFFSRKGAIMSDVLYDAAKAFSHLIKYDYHFILGDSKRQKSFSIITNEKDMFNHVCGLDHLTDIPIVTAKNAREKVAIFKKILNNKSGNNITFSDISSSAYLYEKMSNQINPLTNSQYNIYDRIVHLSNVEKILDNSDKGTIYKWDNKKGGKRYSKIQADYVLVVPSKTHQEERHYFFLVKTDEVKLKRGQNNDRTTPIKTKIISAFSDRDNLVINQDRPRTILEVSKIDTKTKKYIFTKTHPAYQKEKDELAATKSIKGSLPISSDNSKVVKMNITEDKPMQIDFSMQGGAAAMTLNPQMPNNEFFTRIANAIAKGVDSLLHKKSDTKRTQVEISDRQQPTPQQSENKTSTLTKAPAPQPVPQKQSLKAMMSKAAQQKKDMAAATKSMEKWADDVQDIQQSRKNNIHR